MPYLSLYRRYRPQRFGELKGQDHVTRALQNAVRDDRVAHAYLFSGPRGTGKTSTARILAKALNCPNVADGEPCGTCESCVQIQTGASLDVQELDAASNNGVDAMRDLVARAALGTPGRAKVYIVDEVHMLSTAASNALLKTLEEPPAHVTFVLATTDPQKVLPTIRSRAQHLEFRLFPTAILGELVREVNRDAKLGLDDAVLEGVTRRGAGSARDALSALELAATAGAVDDSTSVAADIVDAMAARDAGRAIVLVASGCDAGHDPRRQAEDLLAHLRAGFLALMAPELSTDAPDDLAARAAAQARQLGPAALVRAMEMIGDAIIQMREAADPRVALEVALVRVARPDTDPSPEALLARIERLEKGSVGVQATESVTPHRQSRPSPSTAAPAPAPATAPAPKPAPPVSHSGALPSRDELTLAWGDAVLDSLPQKAKSRFRAGRFLTVEDGVAVYALETPIHRNRAEEVRPEVEAALERHFGAKVPVRLVVEADADGRAAASEPEPAPEPPEVVDVTELADAPPVGNAAEDRLKEAFPGAEEVGG